MTQLSAYSSPELPWLPAMGLIYSRKLHKKGELVLSEKERWGLYSNSFPISLILLPVGASCVCQLPSCAAARTGHRTAGRDRAEP